MCMSMEEFDPFYRSMVADPRFTYNYGITTHLDSGAQLQCYNLKHGMREITMRGSGIRTR